MTTTISVYADTLRRFKDLKAKTGDGDIPELSADAFMKSLMDAWEENEESIYGEVSVELPDDLRERLDRIESAAKEATNAAQSADRKLENFR